MDKRFRCESRDMSGHRCTKRLNHRRKVKNDPHRAFGHEWPAPEAVRATMVAGNRHGKTKAASA